MPGTRCAVFGCNNTYKTKGAEKYTFHRFPKATDFASEAIRNEWAINCRRKDKFNLDSSYICSVHFAESDYQRDLQNELLGLPLRRFLKKTAVPSLGLYNKKLSTEVDDTSTSKIIATSNTKQEIVTLLDPVPSSHSVIIPEPVETDYKISPKISSKAQQINYEEKYGEMLDKYADLNKKYCSLKATSIKNNKKMKILYEHLRYFKNKYYRSPASSKKSVTTSVLRQNKIDLLSQKRRLNKK